jgi:rhodanese-related sulfurtransferase
MKTPLRVLILFAAMSFSIPYSLLAGEVSLEQVKQNVNNMYRTVMDGQPAVSVKNFKRIIASDQEFILLDVRSEAEFNAAHLPGALNVERGRLEWIIPNIIKNPERVIYVYCQDGRRSGFATERLLEMGYKNTSHIAEGFAGWVAAGHLVYNMHGEFVLTPGGYGKREPSVGNMAK